MYIYIYFFYVAKWIPLDDEEQCWWLHNLTIVLLHFICIIYFVYQFISRILLFSLKIVYLMWGKIFFSIVYILFILSVCMKIKRWLILFSYSYFACTWYENGIRYWKCACIDFQVILYNEWQQKSDYSA